MRNVLPDRLVNMPPMFPELKTHLPSGPTVTEWERAIVIHPHEPGQQHLAGIDGGIKPLVPIDVRIHDEVGRLRDDDSVVDDRDTERRDEPLAPARRYATNPALPSPSVSSSTTIRSPSG